MRHHPRRKQIIELEPKKTLLSFSLPLFPFVGGEVLPTTSSPPHLIVFSTLLCILSSFYSLPPLLPSSHLSYHSPPISALASLVSSCPAHVSPPLSSVGCYPPILSTCPAQCSLLLTRLSVHLLCTPVSSLNSTTLLLCVCPHYSCYFFYPVVFAHLQPLLL